MSANDFPVDWPRFGLIPVPTEATWQDNLMQSSAYVAAADSTEITRGVEGHEKCVNIG